MTLCRYKLHREKILSDGFNLLEYEGGSENYANQNSRRWQHHTIFKLVSSDQGLKYHGMCIYLICLINFILDCMEDLLTKHISEITKAQVESHGTWANHFKSKPGIYFKNLTINK